VWVPQLIFGELLTSTNYDKEEKKLVGGKNGYGVKLANIFAKKMVVETVDSVRGKRVYADVGGQHDGREQAEDRSVQGQVLR